MQCKIHYFALGIKVVQNRMQNEGIYLYINIPFFALFAPIHKNCTNTDKFFIIGILH